MSMPPSREVERIVYEKADLVRQLRDLGINERDIVLVRVDFGKLGRIKKPGDRVLIASLLEAIGPRGTLVAQTHSPTQFFFCRDRSYIYEPATAPCVTGRFAEAVLKSEGMYRSLHPTCSIAAIGPRRHDLLGDHDHRSSCFGPMKQLIDAKGKLLLLGCTESSPGFSTIHYTYETLGLAPQSLLSGMIGCYFRKGSRIPWFRQRDIPGCSLGYYKFYALYEERGLLRRGLVANAPAFLIDAADAFRVEHEAVAKCPSRFLCDRSHCLSCRGTKLYNLGDMPRFYIAQVPRKFLRLCGKGSR